MTSVNDTTAEPPGLTRFLDEIHQAGLRENKGKRVVQEVTKVSERNLGVIPNFLDGAESKISKGWSAFHGLRSKLCEMGGIQPAEKGKLVNAMVRSVLTHGLQSRPVAEFGRSKFRIADNAMLSNIPKFPKWRLEATRTNTSDLRYAADATPIDTQIKYHKKSSPAHTLGRDKDNLARQGSLGHFFPPLSDTGDALDYFHHSKYDISTPLHVRNYPTVLNNVISWLVVSCGIPFHAIRWLCEPDNKELFYKLTRESYIRETLADWAHGNHVTTE